MKIINRRKLFFTISGVIAFISVLVWIAWGLNLGIDFTGGALMAVEYTQERPSVDQIQADLAELNLEGLNIQPADEKGYILRFKQIDNQTHKNILNKLSGKDVEEEVDQDQTSPPEADDSGQEEELEAGAEEGVEVDAEESMSDDVLSGIQITDGSGIEIEGVEINTDDAESEEAGDNDEENLVVENRFEAIGPSIGQELKSKSIWAIIIVLAAIVLYIAWAFRKVSYPVNSWKYGIVAIITLFHDILITLGIFIFLGKFLGLEVNTPFVAALLTILGYSVNDTIVIFDRIRENLHKYDGEFEEIVDKSVRETVRRSIFTSITTELVLLSILIFGGATISDFVLVLVIGVLLGTYSSIFIASPLLVVWQKMDWRLKKSE